MIAKQGAVVSEIVGRVAADTVPLTTYLKTVDRTRTDYQFYSSLLRGKEQGYQLGALFAKRIVEIDAEWTLGRGFTYKTGSDAVDELLADFVTDNLYTFMQWRKEANGLGDSYLVLNGDGSLSLKSPDTGQVLVDDFNSIIGYKFIDRFEKVTIEDTYLESGRLVKLTRTTMNGGVSMNISDDPLSFTNPIAPLIPVVHLANDRGVNETYGHPIFEALLHLFAKYDDVLTKTITGVELMGRPIPYVTGAKDPNAVRSDNATRQVLVWNEETGLYEYQPVIDFDEVPFMIFGEGVTFGFAQPGSVAEQANIMLKKLFYLMLETIGIPEWAWGGAIASSKASVDAQSPAFVRYLEGRRAQTESALLALAERWLAYQRVIGFVPAVEKITIEWPELHAKDETLRFQWVQWADQTGKLTDETALSLADLVEDPAAEVAAAREQAQTDEDAFNQEVQRQLALMRSNGNQNGNNPEDE